MKIKYAIAGCCLLVSAFAFADKNSRALKLLEKEKFAKAEALLAKSLEKDSLNPGAHYGLSALFLDTLFARYSIDSSWLHIRTAEAQYRLIDEKEKKKLSRAGINDSTILLQKEKAGSAAFRVAASLHTVPAYNYFIEHYAGAAQMAEATERRNALAWEAARKAHTYESYQYFIETYPEARQIAEAEELYDMLIFEEKTRDRNLESYIRFLEDNPHTPYRNEVEKNIFNLGAVEGKASGFLWFLKTYPNSAFTGRAVNFLYHIFKEENDPAVFFTNYSLPLNDSLAAVADLEARKLIPVYDEGAYGFADLKLQEAIPHSFDEVAGKYLCGAISDDFLLVSKAGKPAVVAKNGETIFDGAYDEAADLGYGALRIRRGGRCGVWHKSGVRIKGFDFLDAQPTSGRLLALRKETGWGLASLTGVDLTPFAYDSIYTAGAFYVFEKGGALAVSTAEKIVKTLHGEPLNLDFRFDDIEELDEGRLLCFSGDEEAVVDSTYAWIFPPAARQIYRFAKGWAEKHQGGYRLYTRNLVPLVDSASQIETGDKWVAVKKGDKWAFWADENTADAGFIYDSANLLSDHFALLSMAGENRVYFRSDSIIRVDATAKIKALKAAHINPGEPPVEYLWINDRSGDRLYDQSGRLALKGRYVQLSALGKEYILLEENGRKGLAGADGELLLKPAYDAIGNYKSGYVSLLRNRKFGFYKRRAAHIPPQYDAMLKIYNDSLFIARKNDGWGIVDADNNALTDFSYQDIRYWNDSAAFVQQEDGKWDLLDLKTKLKLYEGIDSYKIVERDSAERIAIFLKKSQYGLLSSSKGEVIGPAFNDIFNLGDAHSPLYFAEKTIREAQMVVAVYYDENGEILRRQAFTEEEFEKLYCDE